MNQPDKSARREYYHKVVADTPTRVTIPGTKRSVALRGVKPYTLERLTELWIERDAVLPESSSEALKSACIDPYFAVKEALLFVLNDYWKIKLIFPLKWRIWAKLRGYSDEQMLPIIMEGKKKLPLTAHWKVMAYSTDMRTDWMKMTSKEAEAFRAELLSAANLPSLKSILATGAQGVSSSD